ncbi:winged helix-turn-helix domain-containing protein [Streptomyces sp. NPDC055722]
MTEPATPSAELIAGDLAMAIYVGAIRPDHQLPSQTKLMESYGVAVGTASSALRKLAAAGLIRTEPGRGTFAVPQHRGTPSPVMEVMAAASVCRSLAAMDFGQSADNPKVPVGGDPAWLTEYEDEKTMPGRMVDVLALTGIDRHVLRWMSEAFLTAARRLVANGQSDADAHLLEAARAILRDGAKRPEGQPGIAHWGGPVPGDEDVILRIWPERAAPRDPNGPRF